MSEAAGAPWRGGLRAGRARRSGGYLSHKQIMIVLPGLLLTMMLAMLDQLVVGTALPRIVGDLGGVSHLSWVVTAYILASTITTPFYGKLGDMYGRKKLFIFAIVLFLIGSALSGLSSSMAELIIVPGAAGPGRGRTDGGRDGDPRRDRAAPRARQVHELLHGRDDDRHRRRPAARRVDHRLVLLALDLLHQPAGRRGRAGLPVGHAQGAGPPGRAPDRLPGRRAPWRDRDRRHPGRHLGRHRVPLALDAGAGADRARRRRVRWRSSPSSGGRRSRCCRCTCSRAGTSAWP